ncbi:MAG: mechanosensitive ion channel family protein [Oscillospiraceae bacterium]|nr:mechanosensitive ion channel family protein [Oscillospiraceae bacterium]
MYSQLFTSSEPLFVLWRILLTLLLTWLVVRIVAGFTRRRCEGRIYYKLFRKLISAGIFLVGVIMAINQLPNIDNLVATILTGSGIAALAISLAAQESLGNLISGVVISISKPFEVGDRVRLVNGNIIGNIEEITIRHTVIRTFLNSRIIVPNSVMNSDMIENSNIVEERASNFLDVIIKYHADMEKAMDIMAEVIGDHPNYLDIRTPEEMDQPLVPVYVRALSVYGVELRASVWTQSIANNFVTCSEIRREVKIAFDKAGITFASGMLAPPINN